MSPAIYIIGALVIAAIAGHYAYWTYKGKL